MQGDSRDFSRWVKLALHIGPDGNVAVRYADETGRRVAPRAGYPLQFPPPSPWSAGTAAIASLARSASLPPDLAGLLSEAVAPFQGRTREHRLPGPDYAVMPVPWLLPVFVAPPAGLEALPWEEWLEWILVGVVPPGPYVLLRLEPGRRHASAPELPWRVRDDRAGAPMAQLLAGLPWYQDAVQSHGIRLDPAGSGSEPVDVLITDARRARPAARDARLVVEFTEGLRRRWPGTPALSIEGFGAMSEDPSVDLLYGLVHDFALHEVLWILRQTKPGWRFSLACDPRSNQGLRLTHTLGKLQQDILSGTIRVPERFGPPSSGQRLAALNHLEFDFTRETKGLTSIARFLQEAEQRPAVPAVAGMAQGLPAPRSVDFRLDRYDEFGVPEPMSTHDMQVPLRCGWRYRLGVLVGVRDESFSLLEEQAPPIDHLLPEIEEGQSLELEACIFGKDFEVLSPRVAVLLLPRRGPGQSVFFELRAPHAPGEHDLRVVLYHHNNLLQSFQLRAQVDCSMYPDALWPDRRGDRQVVVRLTSSGVDELDDAGGLPRRALSVAMNDDAAPNRHTLMIKGTAGAIEARPTEEHMKKCIQAFQHLMQGAQDKAPFEITLRHLAVIGKQLWRLLESSRLGGDTLRELMASEGAPVQFVRHGSVLSLPWQLLYDLDLPEGDDFVNAQVCWAKDPPGPWPARGSGGCRHRQGPVICIEGFWAYRHILEQLSEERPEGARAARVVATRHDAKHPVLTFGWSAVDDEAKTLVAEWQAALKDRFHELAPADTPAARCLWDQRRPSLLVLLSHMHAAEDARNLPRRLYACRPDTLPAHAISAEKLIDLRGERDPVKDPPLPIVLLLACESSGRDLGDMLGLTDAFLKIGAAAVIGTEWKVRGREAAEFARHACTALLDEQPLGEVMRAWYRRCLAGGRSFPFLFTAYGSADLHLEKGV